MTRAELVDLVYQRHGGLSRREAQDVLDVILRIIRDRLALGERVEIAHFGSFELAASAPREGRHPVTGRRFRVAGKRSLIFRPARALRDGINSEGAEPSTGDLA
jgi:integration host factor subunit alpha